MTYKIAVLPGDGIGPEVTREALRILRAVAEGQFELQFEELPIGGTAYEKHGTPLPQVTLEKCLASDAVLLGAVGIMLAERAEQQASENVLQLHPSAKPVAA